MDFGSRPTFAHQASSTPFLCRTCSAGVRLPALSLANPCQTSACSAVRRRVTFSPPPPIIRGSGPFGGGLSLPSRAFMRGSAAARSFSRLAAVPNS